MSQARRALPLIAVVAVVVAIAMNFWGRHEPLAVDFHTYKAAAVVGLDNGWSEIYDQALVAVQQKVLDPSEVAQPYLSPPIVAWLAVVLVPLPYALSFYTWATLTLIAFAGALAWGAISRGPARWIGVGAAVAPWWVLEAVRVGQVAPLVAAGVPVAWRFLREQRNVAAGLALSLLLLKPNTAFLVPFALLAAGRFKTFATLSIVGAVLAGITFVLLGGEGITEYLRQLTGPLPTGADTLTLERAIGVSGAAATAVRVVIVVAVLVAAFWLRRSPGMVLAVGILGSLLVVPYLHASDLCLLVVAAWIVWEERPSLAWRVPLAAGWLLATPFTIVGPPLNRWPVVELAFLVGLVVMAWQVGRARPPDKVMAIT